MGAASSRRRPAGRRWILVRQVGNWVNGSTLLGILVAKLGGARLRRGPRGLLLAEGYRLGFPLAQAFTVGNVIISGRVFDEFGSRKARLLRHEEQHSWQWFVLYGPIVFVPAYLVATLYSLLRSGSRARHNIFEYLAGLEDGGY